VNCAFLLNQSIFHPQGGGQPTDVGVVKVTSGDKTFHIQVLMVKNCKLTGNVVHCGKVENIDEVKAIMER